MKSRNSETETRNPSENPLYHNTWKLLKRYRDVKWSLELSVQQVRYSFETEFGESVDEYLESLYIAGVDFSGTNIEGHARTIERSRKMLQLVDAAVELIRTKHRKGEVYYWVLYYTFLSTQELESLEDILEKLSAHMRNLSPKTYYRRRREAIEILGSVLWGYESRDCIDILADPTSK